MGKVLMLNSIRIQHSYIISSSCTQNDDIQVFYAWPNRW